LNVFTVNSKTSIFEKLNSNHFYKIDEFPERRKPTEENFKELKLLLGLLYIKESLEWFK